MAKPRGLSNEVRLLKKEMERTGEKLMSLTSLAPDEGTDASERRRQLVWRNFVIKDGLGANAMVLCPEHKDYAEGQEAAAKNTRMVFDNELSKDRTTAVELMRLASIHTHYFGSGGGFEKVVGMRLTPFVKANYNFDQDTQTVKVGEEQAARLRRVEKRQLNEEGRHLQEIHDQVKYDVGTGAGAKRRRKEAAQAIATFTPQGTDEAALANPMDPWGASAAIMRKRGGPMGVDDFA